MSWHFLLVGMYMYVWRSTFVKYLFLDIFKLNIIPKQIFGEVEVLLSYFAPFHFNKTILILNWTHTISETPAMHTKCNSPLHHL